MEGFLLFLSGGHFQSKYNVHRYDLSLEPMFLHYSSCFVRCYRSFLINVKRSNSSDEDTPHRSSYSFHRSIPSTEQEETQSSMPSQPEADVVYVSSSNAKKVKVELESLGYLDKRFKMVKVVVGDTNLIALPITDSCLGYLKQERSGCASNDESGDKKSADTFEGLILKTGRESVPLSSSSLGKLKQRR